MSENDEQPAQYSSRLVQQIIGEVEKAKAHQDEAKKSETM
jgi:hypothetical protein